VASITLTSLSDALKARPMPILWYDAAAAQWHGQARTKLEREAIRLAKESGARLLAIDERDGRRIASACGLRITGTLGVLDTTASEA